MRAARVAITALMTLYLGAVAATPASAETFPYVAPTAAAPTPFAETTVPAGMQFVFMDMFGAQGTGKGAHVRALVPVTPGEKLRVYVGGAPEMANRCSGRGTTEAGPRPLPRRAEVVVAPATSGATPRNQPHRGRGRRWRRR